LRKKSAKQSKKAAIFDAMLGIPTAVIGALGMKPWTPFNFVMAGIVGALATAKLAMIAATPVPFASGAMVQGGRGGVTGQIGEGSEDELITPMESGVDIFARKIVAASRRMFGAGSPGLAFAGAADRHQRAVEHHWHIGTLVADDRGLKEMERRLGGFRVSEAQRKGQTV
jgi:hypothetical protein